MKPISLASVITLVFALFFSPCIKAQSFGISASAVWISDCNQDNYFNTTGSIGPAGNVFTNASLGTHTHNSHTLILRGGEVRTFKTAGSSNVCSAKMYYRIYSGAATGSFTPINLPLVDACDVPSSQFPTGGSCVDGDQKWNLVIPDGSSSPAPIDLTTFSPGNYTLEVYFEATGSNSSPVLCNETFSLNNGGTYYKASFSIQAPSIASANPTTCNGSEGYITISGVTAGETYSVSYSDDGDLVGPANFTANASGEIVITGLDAGIYTDFDLTINGCTTSLNIGVILSNPVLVPTFVKVPAFCAGTTPPTLPSTSTNGITGTWSPAVIDNQTSRSYTFTPDANQCGIPVKMNITVTPRTIPVFNFGTSKTICAGESVPVLPNVSTNGISGTWSPAVVDPLNSGTYIFTPSGSQCANGTNFTVTVNPNITPVFSFGPSLTICEGEAVPVLPTTSDNGITGVWSPGSVDNNNSNTYTFTPNAGQCATTVQFNVTVNPNVTPVFSFGPTLTICAGDVVPSLPLTSDNGISGTWNPSVIDNQNSGTYIFTPSSGVCALPVNISVTVNQKTIPTFSFPSSITICARDAVPVLPTTSNNGITGTWNPAVVDVQNSGSYLFTPDAGQCATSTSFFVTVNPNITPVFNFGSTLTICTGDPVPSLPSTSDNGITGTWNPGAVDNSNSNTYTFTPDGGQCALPVQFNVTVNAKQTPLFNFAPSITICAGDAVPALPSISDNGISGTWNPSVIDNNNSNTYIFTPATGICALPVSVSVTVNQKITPIFSFLSSITICAGESVPVLPNVSTNGISGTWSPAVVDAHNSDTYIFTPDAGQCAATATFSVTVNPNITPIFSFGPTLTVCAGSSVPTLPSTSDNGITGTWSSSAIDNQNSNTYTFTPNGGQCAVSFDLTVTVNPIVTPVFSFGNSINICAGDGVPALPSTSDNGIIGTWSRSAIDNQNSGTYTFTPSDPCATSFLLTVSVTPNTIPTFSFPMSINICDGGTVPVLPTTSNNGITGTWNHAIVDNHNSNTYIFTPDAGQCALGTTLTVTVNSIVTPVFSFGTAQTICAGAAVPTLPTTSDNGITGNWSPAVVDNRNSNTYIFTPDGGQCASGTAFTVTVNPKITPVFGFGSTLTMCAGSSVPSLSSTSDNGITGIWSPATVSSQVSGTYTFTPTSDQCATPFVLTVTVNPNSTPTFDFPTSFSICEGSTPPSLPSVSKNNIAGSWNHAVIDNQNSGTYIFTPDAGQCAVPLTVSVTVNGNVTPTFSFMPALTICEDGDVPVLPTTSDNGITGTWSPAVISKKSSGRYTFTPGTGQCAYSVNFDVTVTPNTVPTFSFGTSLVICEGGVVPTLPTTSNNGLTGSWSPATVSNQTSGVYTFTPDPITGECLANAKFTVTVNQKQVPTFSFEPTLTICQGANVPLLPATSSNGITGTWNPAAVSNQVSGTYTFTPNADQCAASGFDLMVTVPPVATVDFESDTTVTDGTMIPANVLSGTPSGVGFTWTNSNTAIGLAASGTGNIPSFTATNNGIGTIKGTITVTPSYSGCAGTAKSYVITVIPLDKDIFVPNVFSPNGDGKNDILYAYSNYIDKLDMRIFNQYGQQVQIITDPHKGWDGKYKGTPQPVGVYMYTLKAILTDGRTVQLKGSITLLR